MKTERKIMQIVSEIINIPNNGEPSAEYIEEALKEREINPLRWAIVKISKDFFTINCSYDKIALE